MKTREPQSGIFLRSILFREKSLRFRCQYLIFFRRLEPFVRVCFSLS